MAIFLAYFANKRDTFQIRTSEFQLFILCIICKYFVIVFFDRNEKALFGFLEFRPYRKPKEMELYSFTLFGIHFQNFRTSLKKLSSFGDNIYASTQSPYYMLMCAFLTKVLIVVFTSWNHFLIFEVCTAKTKRLKMV